MIYLFNRQPQEQRESLLHCLSQLRESEETLKREIESNGQLKKEYYAERKNALETRLKEIETNYKKSLEKLSNFYFPFTSLFLYYLLLLI